MSRRFALPVFALVVVGALAAGAAGASGSGATASAVSPCTAVKVSVWSPDGTQIAFYGTRWPKPKNHSASNDLLQAFCTMDGSGQNVQPLRYTVCSEKCADFPYQLAWLPSGELVYDIDGGPLYALTPGQKPKRFATVNSPSFATDPAGDRLTVGWGFPGCLSCGGPVEVLDVPSGHVVGKVGGKSFQNISPSLSPDGSQVVFERDSSHGPANTFGIWTASADGSGLRQLERKGLQPLWSPVAGGKIAYRTSGAPTSALRLVSPNGGASRTLVPSGVTEVFGWSPDGKHIAYETGSGKLMVVDVATGKARQLLKLYIGPAASWSPDSSELLVSTLPDPKKCASIWRVPVDGSKATLLRHC